MKNLKNEKTKQELIEETFKKLKLAIDHSESPESFEENIKMNLSFNTKNNNHINTIMSEVLDNKWDEASNANIPDSLLSYAIKQGNKEWCEAIIQSTSFDIKSLRSQLIDRFLEYTDDQSVKNVIVNSALLSILKKKGKFGQGELVNIEHYITKGANINVVDKKSGMSPIFTAIKKNDEALVNLLIKHDVDLDGRVEFKDKFHKQQVTTPLIYAIRENDDGIANLLINRIDNVNEKDNNGKTALMYALEKNEESLYQLLMDKGADIHAMDNDNSNIINHLDKSMASKTLVDQVKKDYYTELDLDNIYKNTEQYIDKIASQKAALDEVLQSNLTKHSNIVQDVINYSSKYDALDLWQKMIDNNKHDETFCSLVADSKNMMAQISDDKILKFYNDNKSQKDLGSILLYKSIKSGRVQLSNYLINEGEKINDQSILLNIFKDQILVQKLPMAFLMQMKDDKKFKNQFIGCIEQKIRFNHVDDDFLTIFEDKNTKLLSEEERQILYKGALDKGNTGLASKMLDKWNINSDIKGQKGKTYSEILDEQNEIAKEKIENQKDPKNQEEQKNQKNKKDQPNQEKQKKDSRPLLVRLFYKLISIFKKKNHLPESSKLHNNKIDIAPPKSQSAALKIDSLNPPKNVHINTARVKNHKNNISLR